MTGKVSLEGLEFHAFHGVYPHERESGNFFKVDITVEADFTSALETDDLAGTVNYEDLFRIVRDEMDKPSKLLEFVAGKIVERVMNELPQAISVSIKISKVNPPIGGKCQASAVSLEKRR